MLDNKIIYFDENVKDASGNWIGGTWIGFDNAKNVARYFEEKNFKLKNSSELGKWMNQVISAQESNNTIVVFAQDVAPYDVFDDNSSNALIRQYLDTGGTILWMGDIPFFHRTKWENDHFERENMANNFLSHIVILGVIPVGVIAASSFSITYEGKQYGLKTTWASSRPIVIPSHLETDRTRIVNFFTCREFIELANVEGIGAPWLRPFVRKGHFQKIFEFLGAGNLKAGPFEVSEPKKENPSTGLEFGMKYLSAWIKIFDIKAKGSGFIRVWDYSPRIITNRMLEEIYTLLRHYCKEKFQ